MQKKKKKQWTLETRAGELNISSTNFSDAGFGAPDGFDRKVLIFFGSSLVGSAASSSPFFLLAINRFQFQFQFVDRRFKDPIQKFNVNNQLRISRETFPRLSTFTTKNSKT